MNMLIIKVCLWNVFVDPSAIETIAYACIYSVIRGIVCESVPYSINACDYIVCCWVEKCWCYCRLCGSCESSNDMLPQQSAADIVYDTGVPQCCLQVCYLPLIMMKERWLMMMMIDSLIMCQIVSTERVKESVLDNAFFACRLLHSFWSL